MALTIVLIDHHPVWRLGLRNALSRDATLSVVGEASNAKEGRALVGTIQPSVVVTEAIVPDGDGIAMAAEMERAWQAVRALIVTAQTQSFFFARARRAGISGYALKTQPVDQIVDAVKAVGRGETYVAPELSDTSLPASPGPPSATQTPFDDLSKREREIFALILSGARNEAMARVLQISVKTVETHRSHINRKLNVHSTGELIRVSAIHGLLVAG